MPSLRAGVAVAAAVACWCGPAAGFLASPPTDPAGHGLLRRRPHHLPRRDLTTVQVATAPSLAARRTGKLHAPVPVSDATVAEVLYEEASKFADPAATAVATTEGMVDITSNEHLDAILATAGRCNEEGAGYMDSHANWRVPHKLVVVQVHANWCRACIGARPKVNKLYARHPEVLCCRLNKGDHEDVAARLGIRALPTFVVFKNGRRVDHFTTTDIDTLEQGLMDNM